MAEQKPLTINNFHQGIAQSANVGFELFRCLNITDKPGSVFPNFALTKESSTTITDEIIDSCWDNQGQLWACSTAKLYKRATNGTWSSITLAGGGASGTLRGLNFWGATTSSGGNKPKGFIFLFAGTEIDLLDLADETTWSKGWNDDLGGSTELYRRSFVASDNILYVAKGTSYGFASIAETSYDAFDGTTGTATLSQSALTLPSDKFVAEFVEIGSKMLICCGTKGNDNKATIYPWNKVSPDFEEPIDLFEDGDFLGWQVVVIGLKAYIHVGKRGKWYITNGTEAVEFASIPDSLTDLNPDSTLLWPRAIDVVNGLIYFAISTDSSQDNLGIYSLNPNNGFLNFEYVISTGADGSDEQLEITSIKSLGNKKFLCSWADDATTYGSDKVDTSRYTSDNAYLISRYYRVGMDLLDRTFNMAEVQLTQPLASGDSVKLYYREAQNGTWLNMVNNAEEDSTEDTQSFMNYDATLSTQTQRRKVNITCQNIQIKAILNNTANGIEINLM